MILTGISTNGCVTFPVFETTCSLSVPYNEILYPSGTDGITSDWPSSDNTGVSFSISSIILPALYTCCE